jgi:hypothetical protein
MIKIDPGIYEKTLKKFKRVKTLLFIYGLVSLCIVIGTTFLNNTALTVLLIALFVSLAIGFIFSFRHSLSKSVVNTAINIIMQEFNADKDIETWAFEEEDILDEETKEVVFRGKRDLLNISVFYVNLFAKTLSFYDVFEDMFFFGKKDNIKFSLRGRLPKALRRNNEDFLPKYYALRVNVKLTEDNIIIISPLKYFSQENPDNLPKADIDTGTRYNIYAQKPNEIPAQIKDQLVPAVIDYAKNLHTWIVTIITSEDIYFVSPQDNSLKLVVFASAQKQIFDKMAEYKELLEIIKVISLLERKN